MVGAVPVCPPVSPHKSASIIKFPAHNACVLVWKRRCANVRAGIQAPPLRFRLSRLRMKTRPLRLGMCPLPMETPPLRIGDVLFANGNATFTAWGVPFTDGNAAARTFGRAHRRRPYHFSCGSVSQGCRKRLCRWTKTRYDCRKRLRRRTKTRKGRRKRLRRCTNMME